MNKLAAAVVIAVMGSVSAMSMAATPSAVGSKHHHVAQHHPMKHHHKISWKHHHATHRNVHPSVAHKAK